MSISPFGEYVREKRTAANKSLREVADALEISHVYLGEVERGRRRVLPEKYWKKLAKEVPGITVKELEHLAAISEPLDPAAMEGASRDVVVALARTLEENPVMSDELAKKLLDLLEKRRKSR
ncbi:MAG: helix-turn-helix domain-containing protein [Gemmatimonadota bacterium]